MNCPKCGAPNKPDVAFCENCGSPMIPASPQFQQPVPQNTAPQRVNGLCIAGFIVSLLTIPSLIFNELFNIDIIAGWLFLYSSIGLTLSIIGFVQANKKKQKLKGLGLAGIIISGVFLLILLCTYVQDTRYKPSNDYNDDDYNYTYEETTTSREETEATRETTTEWTTEETTEATTSESKSGYKGLESVGNEKTGTIALTKGTWASFHEAGGFGKETIEHEQVQDLESGSIIGLFVVDVPYTTEDMTKSQMAVMEQSGATGVTGAKVKLGGRDAYQCYGMFPDGTILVCWYFKGDDGYIRKITVEFGQNYYDIFSMVETNYTIR